MTAPNARAQFPAPRAPLNPVAPPSNPERDWIADTNAEIDRERTRLGLQPRHELRKHVLSPSKEVGR